MSQTTFERSRFKFFGKILQQVFNSRIVPLGPTPLYKRKDNPVCLSALESPLPIFYFFIFPPLHLFCSNLLFISLLNSASQFLSTFSHLRPPLVSRAFIIIHFHLSACSFLFLSFLVSSSSSST